MKSVHEIPGNADAHASVVAAVAPVCGNESVCTQPSANRVWHVVTSPYSTCKPNGEQVCNCVQNTLAASAHAFVPSALIEESGPPASEVPVDPSDEEPPSVETNAPELLDDEHAPTAKTTNANTSAGNFTKTSSRFWGASATTEAGRKNSSWRPLA
jgi:hypothetical protein